MVCLEDGLTACGFRKMSAYVARLNPDTQVHYVTTHLQYKSIRSAVAGTRGNVGDLTDDEVDEVAQGLADADLLGFSSMTGYSDLTRRIIARTRELNPAAFVIWGGIHPIINPEDAITAPVDAICTGEGEFAFQHVYDALTEGRDPTGAGNFWFKRDPFSEEGVTRNPFLALQTSAEMEALPFPIYRDPRERIYRSGEGFVAPSLGDYVRNDGLSYTAIFSIGCPFHCAYCGNTVFIANDLKYKRIRHPSPRYIVDQIKDVRSRSPQINHVNFQDDSFMAIPYPQLEEFAELWKAELDLPFAVYGVIPNYVEREKFEMLTWAGMNRVRMGIQSGSEQILDFYKRPSPPPKIRAAGAVIGGFTAKRDAEGKRQGPFHLPPLYDIIVDNPVETRQDVKDTLELLYDMPRPFNTLIFSLKIIPNTQLEAAMAERGLDLEEINSSYMVIPPRYANVLLYLLNVWRPPRWLWDLLLRRVRASGEPQRLYPRLGAVMRTLHLAKRAGGHIRWMDFSIMPGWIGYACWRIGLTSFWWKHLTPRMPRPPRPEKWEQRLRTGSAAGSNPVRTRSAAPATAAPTAEPPLVVSRVTPSASDTPAA